MQINRRKNESFLELGKNRKTQISTPPLDYDYDYSSKIRRVDTSGKLREIESYIIYIYIYKYI